MILSTKLNRTDVLRRELKASPLLSLSPHNLSCQKPSLFLFFPSISTGETVFLSDPIIEFKESVMLFSSFKIFSIHMNSKIVNNLFCNEFY